MSDNMEHEYNEETCKNHNCRTCTGQPFFLRPPCMLCRAINPDSDTCHCKTGATLADACFKLTGGE